MIILHLFHWKMGHLTDILYCVDDDNKDANEFRYTQDSKWKY